MIFFFSFCLFDWKIIWSFRRLVEEYERYMNDIDLTGDPKSILVMCPICQISELHITNHLLHCKCGFRWVTTRLFVFCFVFITNSFYSLFFSSLFSILFLFCCSLFWFSCFVFVFCLLFFFLSVVFFFHFTFLYVFSWFHLSVSFLLKHIFFVLSPLNVIRLC